MPGLSTGELREPRVQEENKGPVELPGLEAAWARLEVILYIPSAQRMALGNSKARVQLATPLGSHTVCSRVTVSKANILVLLWKYSDLSDPPRVAHMGGSNKRLAPLTGAQSPGGSVGCGEEPGGGGTLLSAGKLP